MTSSKDYEIGDYLLLFIFSLFLKLAIDQPVHELVCYFIERYHDFRYVDTWSFLKK